MEAEKKGAKREALKAKIKDLKFHRNLRMYLVAGYTFFTGVSAYDLASSELDLEACVTYIPCIVLGTVVTGYFVYSTNKYNKKLGFAKEEYFQAMIDETMEKRCADCECNKEYCKNKKGC